MENKLENLKRESDNEINTLKRENADEIDRIKNDADGSIAELAAENISERDTIRFINAFAKDFRITRIIYKSMTREKEISEEPITHEETELVNELNDFYRTAYGERIGDICALDCLVMDGGGEVPFDRMKMKDFKNVSNTDISGANTLYVPLLRGIRGEVAEKAAIKGK